MNEIVNKFLSEGDKCMLQMHLRQPDLLTVLLEHFLKKIETIKKLKETGD